VRSTRGQLSRCDRSHEGGGGSRPEAGLDHPGRFDDDRDGHRELAGGISGKQLVGGFVVVVRSIGDREDHARVDDDRDLEASDVAR
jgi:hypothetical protein